MANNQKLKDFIAKFRQSQQKATIAAVNAINNDDGDIYELNRKQMAVGQDAEGEQFGEYDGGHEKGNKRGWARYRESRGKQTEYIDLHFYGKFYDSIYTQGKAMSVKKPALIIDAKGQRWEDLQKDERFKKALGLNQENRDKVGMMIALEIQKELLRYYKP
jgi:hypothetical protein